MSFIRRIAKAVAALCILAPALTIEAAAYPTKPVSIITAGSAGSGPDLMARLIAGGLAQLWGQQVVVINRPGGGGVISLQAAASAPPDGYTLFVGFASIFVVFPQTNPKIAEEMQRLVPLGLVGDQPMVIAVSPKLGVNTLGDLVEQAKKRPGDLLYGGFRATMPHLAGAMLAARTETNMRFIPSTSPRAVQDVLEGSLHIAIEGMGAIAGPAQSGLLKPLAVSGNARLPDYPDIPTVAEAMPSLAGFEARGWIGLFAPPGTPDAIVEKVNRDMRAALADPEIARKLAAQGVYPRPMSSAEVTEFIRREQDLWRPVVRQLDLASQ